MTSTVHCPSCRQPAEVHRYEARDGSPLTIDLCFACQGIWFDTYENTRLSPGSVLALFELLHRRGGEQHRPLAARLQCPGCATALDKGFDVAKGGRYVTYRCAAQHGRFSTFGAFMVEKGFVRHLSEAEITALARRVGTIACAACGGTVDIRQDHACPWCRSALALLDHEAVNKALQQYGADMQKMQQARSPDALADALVSLERQNARDARERQRERMQTGSEHFDLISAGVELVWSLLRR